MAHFIRPNGRLDKTYPNQYGHTIPHSWSNKITKQEVHKSYILNLFGCHLICNRTSLSADIVRLIYLSILGGDLGSSHSVRSGLVKPYGLDRLASEAGPFEAGLTVTYDC